jgi:hypothetical protein
MKQIENSKPLSYGLRILLIFLLLFITSTVLFAETSHGGTGRVRNGVGLGTIIAVVLSWSRNQSVLWAIIHGILNWLYVIYFVLSRGNQQYQ